MEQLQREIGMKPEPRRGHGNGTAGRDPASIPGLEALDAQDPRDQAIAALIQDQQDLRTYIAQQQIQSTLESQNARLEARDDYDAQACMQLVRDAAKVGKRIDLEDAYNITRGRRAEEMARIAAEKARAESRREQTANTRVVSTGTMAGSAPPPREDRVYSRAEVKSMSLATYKELKDKGYGVNSRGEFSRIR